LEFEKCKIEWCSNSIIIHKQFPHINRKPIDSLSIQWFTNNGNNDTCNRDMPQLDSDPKTLNLVVYSDIIDVIQPIPNYKGRHSNFLQAF
jgi:hypothetical protein